MRWKLSQLGTPVERPRIFAKKERNMIVKCRISLAVEIPIQVDFQADQETEAALNRLESNAAFATIEDMPIEEQEQLGIAIVKGCEDSKLYEDIRDQLLRMPSVLRMQNPRDKIVAEYTPIVGVSDSVEI
jgi:hypothetical protein